MAKNYVVQFGSGNPASNTGLTPTLILFNTIGGSMITAPGITEIPTATGLYYFTWSPTNTIAWVMDGGAALASSIRYVTGVLDPIDAVDEKVADMGSPTSSIGDTSTLPTTIWGYVQRLLQWNEGNSTFNKTSGVWSVYSIGSSTLLRAKTLADSSGSVTKT